VLANVAIVLAMLRVNKAIKDKKNLFKAGLTNFCVVLAVNIISYLVCLASAYDLHGQEKGKLLHQLVALYRYSG